MALGNKLDGIKILSVNDLVHHYKELGSLTKIEIDSLVKSEVSVECEANAGDMLIMRPLILHASSKAKFPKHRRVIHLEFNGYDLSNDIYWK